MNQEELKTLVAQMLRELAPQPEPQVKGSEYRPTVSESKPTRQPVSLIHISEPTRPY